MSGNWKIGGLWATENADAMGDGSTIIGLLLHVALAVLLEVSRERRWLGAIFPAKVASEPDAATSAE